MDIINELTRLLSFYAARTKIDGFVGEQATKDLAKLGHLFQICIDIAKDEANKIAAEAEAPKEVVTEVQPSTLLDELNANVGGVIVKRRRRRRVDASI